MVDRNPWFKGFQQTPLFSQAKIDYDMHEVDIDASKTMDLFTREPYTVSLTDFLSSSIGIFGASRTGKSVTVARILEEIIGYKMPFTIFDKEGDFFTLLDYSPFLKVYYFKQNIEDEKKVAFKIKERWFGEYKESVMFEYSEDAIKELAKKNFYKGLMSVFDLSSIYDRTTRMQIVYNYARQMEVLSNELYEEGTKLHHLLFLDESAYYLPSQYSDFYDKTNKLSKPMVSLFSSIASTGMKRGLNLYLSAQRISHVSNDTVANFRQFFFHKSTIKLDKDKYKNYVSANQMVLDDLESILATMIPGDVIYVLNDRVWETHVKPRRSKHTGRTPKPSDTFRTLERLKKMDVI